MTTSADRTIQALRTGHDSLTDLVTDLSPAALSGSSGASEWTIAQVLSHLGSGAEIGLAVLEAALAGTPGPDGAVNQGIWDRWNAMDAVQQAETFVKANEALVSRYESLEEQARADLRIDLGFFPEPVELSVVAGFRLNEFTLHSWDVAVALDPAAVLAPDAVELLMDVAPHLLGWLGRPEAVLAGRSVAVAVEVDEPARTFGLLIDEKTTLADAPQDAAATVVLPAESWLRLISGRLAEAHTPAGVEVTGAITLPELRRIFPGY